METRWVASGKCFKKMDLKMTLPNGVETIVKVHFYDYFCSIIYILILNDHFRVT